LAGLDSREVLRHSVLDRLAGTDGQHTGADLRISVEDLKFAVLRDIEWLLNTKRPVNQLVDNFPEASSSILNFGIPDFSQYSASSGDDCTHVCGLIQEAVRRFEPRLEPRSVMVDHVATEKMKGLQAQFRIRGILHVDPVRVPVSFDTHIEMDSGAIAITPAE
jgi:type VI secretion system protein ImpF